TPICDWPSVSCDTDHDVDGIFLDSLGIRGSIPDSIGNLSSLRYFTALQNMMSGTIPAEL
ncbi:unnamed protein product, partial [Ectocarpus fasciculatus]